MAGTIVEKLARDLRCPDGGAMRDAPIELAGFMITAEEWRGMDAKQRAQLVRAATRRDEPWIAPRRDAGQRATSVAITAGEP
jgi:hypothetical protein